MIFAELRFMSKQCEENPRNEEIFDKLRRLLARLGCPAENAAF